jgi:exosortase
MTVVAAALVAAAFLGLYWPTIGHLVEYWSQNDMYSYGFAVPFISGYLIWLRRYRLAEIPIRPSFAVGVPALFIVLAGLMLGRLTSTNLIEELTLPASVTALSLLLFGTRMTRACLFPLAYLFTMVPFWGFLTEPLQWPFQLYSATVGVGLLRLLNIPVVRDGIYIQLPNVTLEVAQLCSGVNHLVAVLCVGVPAANLFVSSWRTRAFIVASAVTIALLSNALRVAIVALFAYNNLRGPDGDIHGPYSVFRSLLISLIGFVALFWLISRLADKSPWGPDDASRRRYPSLVGVPAVIGIVMLTGCAALLRWHTVTPVAFPAAQRLAFPIQIEGWQFALEGSLFPSVDGAGFDVAVVRRYVAPDGSQADVLLGYYSKQQQARELAGYGMTTFLRRERIGNAANEAATYSTYWYIVDGRVMTSPYEVKARTAWNALFRRRTNGGIVVVRQKSGPSETRTADLEGFVRAVRDASTVYFPRSGFPGES